MYTLCLLNTCIMKYLIVCHPSGYPGSKEIFVLQLVIVTKSEAGAINYCLGLHHEFGICIWCMVCKCILIEGEACTSQGHL